MLIFHLLKFDLLLFIFCVVCFNLSFKLTKVAYYISIISLCPALKNVFQYGLKKSSLLGSAGHPWLFLEEAATKEVEKDFESVYSRLVLCKTYRYTLTMV